MKRIHFLLASSILVFSGCSTYKQAQTPDDVYYSPGAVIELAVTDEYTPNQREYYSVPNDNYVQVESFGSRNGLISIIMGQIIMAAYSPMAYGPYGPLWNGMVFLDMELWFRIWHDTLDRFRLLESHAFWNSYYTWNRFYNPYYGGMIVTNPKVGNVGTVTRLSTFSPSSYTNYAANRGNVKPSSANTPYEYSQTIRRSYNANSYNSYGNNTRQNYFRPSVNSNNTLSNQSRSYSPRVSSFGSGGGGGMSRGGGGGGISRGR